MRKVSCAFASLGQSLGFRDQGPSFGFICEARTANGLRL